MKNVQILTWLFNASLLLISNSCKKSGDDGPTPPPHPNGTVYAGITGRITGDKRTRTRRQSNRRKQHCYH